MQQKVQRTMGAYKNLSWLYGKGAVVLKLSHEELVRISEENRRREGGKYSRKKEARGHFP